MIRMSMVLAIVLAACGDDDVVVVPDAGPRDAGGTPDAGVDGGPRDAGPPDVGFVFPDAGPPPTGCDLQRDAGPAADAGAPVPLAPEGYPPLRGPGGPRATFTADQLMRACAYLDGGEIDRDHHNTVFMHDGYLWMSFAHEAGRGGIAAFDVTDACNPVRVALGTHEMIRETHATGIARIGGGHWLAVTSLSGIQIWDIQDLSDVHVVADLALPGVVYPDSYMRVVMSVFWQAPYLYIGASDNGVFVVEWGTHDRL